MMKKTLQFLIILLPVLLLGQNTKIIDFPNLHLNDTLIILLKRNMYEEKIIITKNINILKFDFFKKSIVLQLNEKNNLTKKEKGEYISMIEDYNYKFYNEGIQKLKGDEKNDKSAILISEKYLIIEERFIYTKLKKIIFPVLSNSILTDRHTDIQLIINGKLIDSLVLKDFITCQDLIFN